MSIERDPQPAAQNPTGGGEAEEPHALPGPQPQPGGVTAFAADFALVVAGTGSATVMAYLFNRVWEQSVVTGTVIGVVLLIQRVAARRAHRAR